ncbi:MAG: ArnT family glycosyltransferase [Isosphaeraceae bacterium]
MTDFHANGFRLVAMALGFPAVALTIGYAALGRAGWMDRRERFAAAWGVGFAALAASQFLAFLTGIDPRAVHPTFLILALAAAWALGRFVIPGVSPNEPNAPREPAGVGLWLLGLAHLAVVQTLLPCYLGGGWAFDWWMHYEKARVFVGHLPVSTTWLEKYSIASRTPLMNLTLAGVLSVAGDTFWTYQWASVLTSAVVVLPLALVAGDLAGGRAARLVLIAAPLNVWLLHEAWFTWTKMLASYYLFLSLHFYSRWLETSSEEPSVAWRRFLACWVASLLAFLTHQITLVYTAAMAVHALVVNRRRVRALVTPGRTAALAGLAVGLVGPWYAWLWRAVGPSKIVAAVPTAVVLADHAAQSRWKVVKVYATSAWATFVPDRLIAAALWEPFSAGAIVIHLTALYFCQIPGALTLSLCVYLVAVARVESADPPVHDHRSAVWTFGLLGGLAALLLTPYESRYGLAHNSLVPSTLAAMLGGWCVLSRGRGWGVRLACLGMMAEFLGVFWGHLAWLAYYRDTGKIATDLNWQVRNEYGLVFLNEAVGPAAPWLLGACLVIQCALARRWIEWSWRGSAPEPSNSR